MNYSDLTIIIPTLNEEKSIKPLISDLLARCKGAKIIVSDDGSSDSTRTIVVSFPKKQVMFLDRSTKPVHGLTASVLDGINACSTRFFIVMDGDLQHPPEKVPEVFSRLVDGNKVVIASRKKVDSEWPVSRRLVSYGATLLGWVRLLPRNYFFSDVLSGFFGMETELAKGAFAARPSAFVQEGYKALFDFLKVLPKEKAASVDYVFGSRRFGQSKLGTKHIFFFMQSLLK